MENRSPCLSCDLLDGDKNAKRCTDCRRRLAYVNSLEQAPECRQDPCYAAAYVTPRSFARQIGPPAYHLSQSDYMVCNR